MTPKNRDPHCKAQTKSGQPCRAAATAGGLCFFHANPNKASELGRIGGRSKRHSGAESTDPLPKLDSAMAVRDAVAQLIADVYAGKLQPKVAAGLAPLMNLQLRTIEITDHELRLATVEKRLAEVQNLRVSADFKKRLMEEAAQERRPVTNYFEATLLAHWERRNTADGKEKGKKK